jgi:hypothetical protein
MAQTRASPVSFGTNRAAKLDDRFWPGAPVTPAWGLYGIFRSFDLALHKL